MLISMLITLIYILLFPNIPIEMNLLVGTWVGEGIELKLEKSKSQIETMHHFGQFKLIQSHTKLTKNDQSNNQINGLWWLKTPTSPQDNPHCLSASIETYHFSCLLEWQLVKDLPKWTKDQNQPDSKARSTQPILILYPSHPSPVQASFVLIIRLTSFFP
jgi:hypothetical protein